MTDPADEQIVLLAMTGHETSFAELVLRHQGWVRSLVRRSLPSATAAADDVAQEVFIKAWRKLPGLRDARAFHGWLRRIAVHAIVDQVRLRHDLEDAATDDEAETPVDLRAEDRIDLQACLSRLTPGQRLCVLLVHGEGLTHREAAEETGLPIGTVKSHLARATPLLRTWLAASDPCP
ncbi:RNA polymerase sigma factor [Brevundimonas sp.]|uniref:RNA polymerase sigma factor n=1 Tax=Brevundimonas sp. TaxID=1871086 RepID=UPI003F72C6E6